MSRRLGLNRAPEKINYQKDVDDVRQKEGNLVCADCKVNPQPRWTSVTYGVFICIRCSGIHRNMGTHISRVKSVNLDSWTKDYRDMMLAWGNIKANKFWEAKLDEKHRVPNEAKIESFIRTKYETGKWRFWDKDPVAGMFDDEADDNVPLNVVQEKAKVKRESSLPATSMSSQPIPPPPKAKPIIDLIDHASELPIRPSTTDTNGIKPPLPKSTGAPKPTGNTDSLLGLEEIYGAPSPATNARPSSSASTPSDLALSRKELMNNILSMYAKPQQPAQHEPQASTGSMQPPPIPQQPDSGGLNDAFTNLKANPPVSPLALGPINQQQPKSDPFASFNSAASLRSSAALPKVTPPAPAGNGVFDQNSKSMNIAASQFSSAAPPKATRPAGVGNGFFKQKPQTVPKPSVASKPPQIKAPKADPLPLDDFGPFNSIPESVPAPSKPAAASAANDLFDFSEPSPPARAPPPSASTAVSSPSINSAFNLSAPALPSKPTTNPSAPPQSISTNTSSAFSNMDAWGSSNAWATPEPTPSTITTSHSKPTVSSKQPSVPMANDFSGWGDASTSSNGETSAFSNGFGNGSQAAPKVAPDEDFGGWNSATPVTPVVANPRPPQSKPAGGANGFGGGDDLFSNVWE